jgi:hypothetical protein
VARADRFALILAAFLVAAPASGQGPVVGRASVIDGDTIEIAGERIRFNGIDAPETWQTCLDKAGAKYRCGKASADALEAFLAQSRPTAASSSNATGTDATSEIATAPTAWQSRLGLSGTGLRWTGRATARGPLLRIKPQLVQPGSVCGRGSLSNLGKREGSAILERCAGLPCHYCQAREAPAFSASASRSALIEARTTFSSSCPQSSSIDHACPTRSFSRIPASVHARMSMMR